MDEAGTSTTVTAVQSGFAAPIQRRGAILIVEDRDDVRQGLSQLLEMQGYVVFEARDFNEAMAQLESSPQGIALILLDLVLPGPGGEQIRAAQLANPMLSRIPAIVVSACSPDGRRSGDLRAAAWIEKPFRFDQLLVEVQRFVLPAVTDLKTSTPALPPDA